MLREEWLLDVMGSEVRSGRVPINREEAISHLQQRVVADSRERELRKREKPIGDSHGSTTTSSSDWVMRRQLGGASSKV